MFSESPEAARAHWHDAAERALGHWSHETKSENEDKEEREFVPWGGEYELVGGMSSVFIAGLGLDYRLVFHDMRELDAWRCITLDQQPDGDIDLVPGCRDRLSKKAETGRSRCDE